MRTGPILIAYVNKEERDLPESVLQRVGERAADYAGDVAALKEQVMDARTVQRLSAGGGADGQHFLYPQLHGFHRADYGTGGNSGLCGQPHDLSDAVFER